MAASTALGARGCTHGSGRCLGDLARRGRPATRAAHTIVPATNKVNESERHCARVAFIHRGRMAAEGAPAALKAGLKRDAVWVEWPGFTEALAEELRAWEGVGRLTCAPPPLHATVDAASAFVPRL